MNGGREMELFYPVGRGWNSWSASSSSSSSSPRGLFCSFSVAYFLNKTKTLILLLWDQNQGVQKRREAMDGDSSWSARLSSASRRYQSALQSRSGFIFSSANFNFFLQFFFCGSSSSFSFRDTGSVRTYEGVRRGLNCNCFDLYTNN